MKRKFRLELQQLPPVEFSPNWHGHWAVRYSAGQDFRKTVYYGVMEQVNRRKVVAFNKARLDLTFVFARKNRRDEDNLRARFKPGQDTLVLAGLIPDDNPEHLVMGNINILVDRARAPLTIIELEDVS